MATAKRFIVVLAWAEKDGLKETGRFVERDRNYFPEYEFDWKGRAAVWVNGGTCQDVVKAKAHAAQETSYQIYVFTYPTDEPEPLGKAKKSAEEMAAKLELNKR